MEQHRGQGCREGEVEYGARGCRDSRRNQWTTKFCTVSVTSSSVFQNVGGNCPSTQFSHLETAGKILHVMYMCVSREVCRFSHLGPQERLIITYSKSQFQMTFLPKVKQFSKLYFCIFDFLSC